eukprot:TRINITY_DN850_c0_g1_i1.p1 TRINITY_DN850_c0_g1~~TRINITY_DN850_c0_g1_i1.p1  ORF type:complete len:551 (-),score=79.11 TRINITY_DN850_c0_g1_i1:20-1672(-)
MKQLPTTTILMLLISILSTLPTTHTARCDLWTLITEQSGTIKDHEGDGLYEPISNCTWVIQPESFENGSSIVVSFEKIDVEYVGDSIKVYNGLPWSEETLVYNSEVRKDNKEMPPVMWSEADTLYINFLTDSGGEGEGFTFGYFAGFCSDNDGGLIISTDKIIPEGVPLITTSYLPAERRHTNVRDYHCVWLIRIQDHSLSTLFVDSLHVGNDKLTVEYAYNHKFLDTQFYDLEFPQPIQSQRDIRLELIGSGNIENKFEANFIYDSCTEDVVVVKSSYGIINDGSSPDDNYIAKASRICKWHIDMTNNPDVHYIDINFQYLNLEKPDYISIKDDNSNIIAEITGQNITTKNVRVMTDSVFVTFTTNFDGEMIGRSGFGLSWTACNKKCTACKPGFYYSGESNECHACPPDTISNSSGNTQCRRCEPGYTFVDQVTCQACKPGTYYIDLGNSEICGDCEIGKVSLLPASTECSYCPRDSTPLNVSYCVPCKEGFEASPGAKKCTKKPDPKKGQGIAIIYTMMGIGILLLGCLIYFMHRQRTRVSDPWEMY